MKQTYTDINQFYNQFVIPFRKALGKQLLQLREDNEFTAYQVSKRLGGDILVSDIHDYESGRYNIISLETLLRLAQVYHKSVRVVFDDTKV